jgi:hypothetical protein
VFIVMELDQGVVQDHHGFVGFWCFNPLCQIDGYPCLLSFVKISCSAHKWCTRLYLSMYVESQSSTLQTNLPSFLTYWTPSLAIAGGGVTSSTTTNPKRKNLMIVLTFWVKVEQC